MNPELAGKFAAIGQPRVLVVGDLMLDRYVWGTVDRISPEAPIPVLKVEHEDQRPGGAGSVAVAFWSIETWEREVGYHWASQANDVERLEIASRRLAFIGRDGPGIHQELGRQLVIRGRTAQALDEYRKSYELAPMPAAWPGMSAIYERLWTRIRKLVN